jgi:DNA-binding GntR family transcriptional regulator
VSEDPRQGVGRREADRHRIVALFENAELTPSRRYRELAGFLRAAIASGALPVGTRLPPQRELAELLSVGRTTVVSAYNLLLAESLIVMTQGAGTWVTSRPSQEHSPEGP